MYLNRTDPPAETPISLDEAKANLRVVDTAEDALITSYIEAQTDWLDGEYGQLRRALITQSWEASLPAGFPPGRTPIELPLPPLQSVESIDYLDADGQGQTLDPSLYVVETAPMFGRVRPATGTSWPATGEGDAPALVIKFKAGYGDAGADVPAAIRQALQLLVADSFGHRGDDGAAAPVAGGRAAANTAADNLIAPYKTQGLA